VKNGTGKYISQEYSTQTRGKPILEGTKTTRGGHKLIGAFFGIAVIIGVSLISFTVVFFYSGVNGTSMMMTLNASGANTDSVIVNRYKKPERGDIIVLNHYDYNGNHDSLHIKRLLATGGERVCFIKVPKGSTFRYRVEINDVEYDNDLYDVHIDNIANALHNYYFAWQEGGTNPNKYNGYPYHESSFSQKRFEENGTHDAPFRDRPDMSRPDSYPATDNTFHYYNATHVDKNTGLPDPRWEILLPAGFMFYMGDNRGGDGSPEALKIMSADATYYGPQPFENIVGVVIEIVHNRSAAQWFIDKVLFYATFTLYRPNEHSYEKPH